MHSRRTKIVATLGPATSTPAQIEHLARAGMDVARLNFSHGSYDEHAQRIEAVREASAATGRLPTIEGTVPDLTELPPGCRFEPRCSERSVPRSGPIDPSTMHSAPPAR